jgi:hypothetical protein
MKFNKLCEEILGESMPKGHVVISKNVSNKVDKIYFYWEKNEKFPKVPKKLRDVQEWDIYQTYTTVKAIDWETRGKYQVAIVWLFSPKTTTSQVIQNVINSFTGEYPRVSYKLQMLGTNEPTLN